MGDTDQVQLRYIPIALWEVGCCKYGQGGKPYKTVVIPSDVKDGVLTKAEKLLQPSITESIYIIGYKPNPEYVEHQKQRDSNETT